jgi:hypothetical protein
MEVPTLGASEVYSPGLEGVIASPGVAGKVGTTRQQAAGLDQRRR